MWTANLFHVASGSVGPQLNFDKMSWSISLNETESFSVSLRKSDLPEVDLNFWLAPWWAGIVILWNGVPIVAGPITSRPSEDFKSIGINCAGIRAVLSRRICVLEQEDWSRLAKSVIQYTNLSLGTIGSRVVKQIQAKPGGMLPISFPVPDQTAANTPGATHQRTYQGFNVQNINADDILTKLSNVIDGPDVMFKPRMIEDNRLTFDMWHGTEHQPRIYQNNTPVWDTTAQEGAVVDAQVITSGESQTSRVYSIGAGMDQGQLMTVSTNNAPLAQGFPLLETVYNGGNSENKSVVEAGGRSRLMTNAKVKQQLQLVVSGIDPVNSIGTFWPGDLVKVVVKGWLSIPNGTTDFRLLNMNGDESSNVRLSLQPESQFIIDD